MLVIYRTFASVEITGRFDEELLEVLPKSVRFVCHNGMLKSSLPPLQCPLLNRPALIHSTRRAADLEKRYR